MDQTVYLYRLLAAAPVLLVMLAGLLFCLLRWHRGPAVCAVTGLALGIALFTRVVLPWISTWVFRTFLTEVADIRWRVLIDGTMTALSEAAAWGLLLWVIFGMRAPHDPAE